MGMLDGAYAYCAALEKRGYVKLGGGLYSVVYAINADFAIKVGHNDNWPNYIEWATQAGFAGTFAPKVYSLKFHRGFYVAIMERLACTMADLRADNGCPSKDHYEMVYKALRESAGRRFRESAGRIFEEKADGFEDLKAFGGLAYEAGFNDDLHRGNVMLRRDGQIVLIDPSSNPPNKARLRIKRGLVTTPSE